MASATGSSWRRREAIAAMLAERHVVLPLDLRAFGGSALTRRHRVPKDGRREGIPVTYVPARNTIFLSLALGLAEASGARDIFIGVNALDYSGYPDCRPEFIAEFERLANVATKAGVEGEPFTHPRAAAAHDQGRDRARGASGSGSTPRSATAATIRCPTGGIAAAAMRAGCAPRDSPRRGSRSDRYA